MVKGISRQVIVVHSPDPKLFDQAIFILKEDAAAHGITDEQLLQEAKRLMRTPGLPSPKSIFASGPVWAACGAALTAVVWLVTACVF